MYESRARIFFEEAILTAPTKVEIVQVVGLCFVESYHETGLVLKGRASASGLVSLRVHLLRPSMFHAKPASLAS